MKSNSTTVARSLAGIALVAGVYLYFLIFAQFAFLRLVEQSVGAVGVRPIMACMAIAGLVGSWCGWVTSRTSPLPHVLVVGFLGCAAAALQSTACHTSVGLALGAAQIGFFLGLLTVSCSGNLPLILGETNLPLKTGAATGLAYGLANVPLIFESSPIHQCWMMAGVCVLGGGLSLRPSPSTRTVTAAPFPFRSPLPLVAAVFIFGALVWFDSAAFLIIQSTPELDRHAWSGSAHQLANGTLHLCAALGAGWLLQRGYWRFVIGLAFVCLAAGVSCLWQGGRALPLTPIFYTCGVSLYSTALLLFPSMGKDGDSPARAAWIYAIAGWGGSALGIGMAQDLHAVPGWFVVLAGMTIAGGLLFRDRRDWPLLVTGMGMALIALLIASDLNAHDVARVEAMAQGDEVEAGRRVYISEGCINCHSQYIRPGTADVEEWGPPADPATLLAQSPPLLGNRRQGPDLTNIGIRRSPSWNRLHLLDPRQLSPGSPMPSYAHLFAEGETRGPALLAYLESLGANSSAVRREFVQTWEPKTAGPLLSLREQRRLFEQSCAVCHGVEGRGDGPLATLLGATPRNLTLAQWNFIPRQANDEAEAHALARVIKFGVPGTSMPGHEMFSYAEALSLAHYVRSLRGGGSP